MAEQWGLLSGSFVLLVYSGILKGPVPLTHKLPSVRNTKQPSSVVHSYPRRNLSQGINK